MEKSSSGHDGWMCSYTFVRSFQEHPVQYGVRVYYVTHASVRNWKRHRAAKYVFYVFLLYNNIPLFLEKITTAGGPYDNINNTPHEYYYYKAFIGENNVNMNINIHSVPERDVYSTHVSRSRIVTRDDKTQNDFAVDFRDRNRCTAGSGELFFFSRACHRPVLYVGRGGLQHNTTQLSRRGYSNP